MPCYEFLCLIRLLYGDAWNARHSQDHVPKFSFRSTKTERLIRFRDERLRNTYQVQLNEDPNILYASIRNFE